MGDPKTRRTQTPGAEWVETPGSDRNVFGPSDLFPYFFGRLDKMSTLYEELEHKFLECQINSTTLSLFCCTWLFSFFMLYDIPSQ